MNKKTIISIVGLAASAIGAIATFVAGCASDKKSEIKAEEHLTKLFNEQFDQRFNEAFSEFTKEES